jgi:hypothetical protein
MANFVDRLAARLKVRKPFLYAGGAVIGLGLVSLFRRRAAIPSGPPFAYPSFLTGRRLTFAPVGSNGLVDGSPERLSREAGLDADAYTLARILASETSGPALEKASIAWAVANYAHRQGRSILSLGTTATGQYGRQAIVGYAATSKDPTDRDAHVATMILARAWPDPTGGAIQWFDPNAQDALFARGEAPVDAEGLIARRIADGREPVLVPGLNPREIVFFRLRA